MDEIKTQEVSLQENKRKEKPNFALESIMSAKDLRKMVYIGTFLRNYFTIPFVFLLCFGGNYLMASINKITDTKLIIETFVFLFLMTILLMCFRIERRNKKRIKYDGAVILNRPLKLDFYDDRIESSTGERSQKASLGYESFFQLIETKDYFLFYHNISQVSLLRKKEIENVDKFREFIVAKFPKKYKRIKIA